MQFSLFEKRPLFDDETLQRRENEWRTQIIDGFEESRRATADFIKEVQLRKRKGTKETALEQEFNRAFFVGLLGYSLYPGNDGRWSAWPKPPTSETGLSGEPDLVLGNFDEDTFTPTAVVELKRPGTNLDAPQPGYDGRTPVEQAFQYSRRLSACQWVVVSDSAVKQPGSSTTKAYDALKALFRDLDEGRDTQFWKVPKYNGELFKRHAVLDNISLPDALYAKTYSWTSTDGRARRNVQGVFGLHVFDFWKELDRDLLGNVFERSIGDLEDIALGVSGRRDARAAFGIFYTASKLAQFAASSVVAALLEDNDELTALLSESSMAAQSQLSDIVERIFSTLKSYRIVDLACGSGVFPADQELRLRRDQESDRKNFGLREDQPRIARTDAWFYPRCAQGWPFRNGGPGDHNHKLCRPGES